MKQLKFYFFVLVWLLVTGSFSPVSADSYSKSISVFRESASVQPFFENCYGYAVFPLVGKGGFVVGGAYGEGQVYRQGILSGRTSLIKLSVGFQLGGQAFSEIIFFQDKGAYNRFINGNFEFDASFSAVVITAGVQVKAGTEGGTASVTAGPATGAQAQTQYTNGMVVFIHPKGGLMYEGAIGGQKFSYAPL